MGKGRGAGSEQKGERAMSPVGTCGPPKFWQAEAAGGGGMQQHVAVCGGMRQHAPAHSSTAGGKHLPLFHKSPKHNTTDCMMLSFAMLLFNFRRLLIRTFGNHVLR